MCRIFTNLAEVSERQTAHQEEWRDEEDGQDKVQNKASLRKSPAEVCSLQGGSQILG